jgi:glutathione S-transferase
VPERWATPIIRAPDVCDEENYLLKVLGRSSSSNVQKVLWLIAELGQDCEHEEIGGKYGGNRDAAYLALNPNGVVPTIIDDSFVLWESNSICRYLAAKFSPTPLYPAEIEKRASCERWMDWQLSTLSPALGPMYMQLVRTPAEERDAQVIENSRRQGRAVLSILERQLTLKRFLDGDTLTLADMVNGIWAHRWFTLNHETDSGLDRVHAWYQRLSERKPYRDCVLNIPLE